MRNIFVKRKQQLRELLTDFGLDTLLLYSSSLDSRYSKWIAGIRAPAFHYYFLTTAASGFWEVNYFAPELRVKTDEEVTEISDNNLAEQIEKLLRSSRKVGVVGEVPFNHLVNILPTYEVVDLTDQVDMLLLVKSEEEIQAIQEAARVLQNAFMYIGSKLVPGITTHKVARALQTYLLDNAEELAFPVSIASSQHLSDSTIATPNNTLIKDIDSICIDIGVVKNGFYADATRMFFLNEPHMEELYSRLLKVNSEIANNLNAGTSLGDLVVLYNQKLQQHALPATLEKADLGHSIGFGLHEYPNFYQDEQKEFILKRGMVVTLEPEIVFRDYRLRVENMVLIGQEGSAILV